MLGIVSHVANYRRLPASVVQADVRDAIRIIDHLQEVFDSATLGVIEAGREAGMTWEQIAAARGSTNRQAGLNWYRRLQNAVRGTGTKDDTKLYAEQRWRKAQKSWCDTNSRRVAAILVRLHKQVRSFDVDTRDALAELVMRLPLPGESVSPAFVAELAGVLRDAAFDGARSHPETLETLEEARGLLATQPSYTAD
ncbi:hypothetical protein [Polymorphospora sp. NPDC050346]|uniref:hypothetical protein n=1 Tax=Polymorphospora sp. NPDC050346 TaxID=3155780 RepID=UPI0033ED1EDE